MSKIHIVEPIVFLIDLDGFLKDLGHILGAFWQIVRRLVVQSIGKTTTQRNNERRNDKTTKQRTTKRPNTETTKQRNDQTPK